MLHELYCTNTNFGSASISHAWLTEAERKFVFVRRCRWVPCGNRRMLEMALGRSYMPLVGISIVNEEKRRSSKTRKDVVTENSNML
jgi:hypothetical protein